MSRGRTKCAGLVTQQRADFVISHQQPRDSQCIKSKSWPQKDGTPPPPALRCLDLKNGVSNGHLGFSEDFNKSTKKHKTQVVDIQIILFTYQAYAADGANVNSNKFHSVYKLLTQRRRDLICYLACRFRPQQCSVGLLGPSGRLRLS